MPQHKKKKPKRHKNAKKHTVNASSDPTSSAAATATATANGLSECTHHNLLTCGCLGCYVADKHSNWILGERSCQSPMGEDGDSDAAEVDPDSQVQVQVWQNDAGVVIITIENHSDRRQAAYVTAETVEDSVDINLYDRKGNRLATGHTADFDREKAEYQSRACVTFIAIVEAQRAIDLAQWDASDGVAFSKLAFELNSHPKADDKTVAARFDQFPLGGKGPYLCTQGEGGRLTHFFPESYHAFDLRCDEGTPVLAVADGKIVDLTQAAYVTGVHCNNLTKWNSIGIKTGDGVIVEYVHIAPGSALVREGDSVKRGQPICTTGKIGFAPEPHVHIEAHLASDPQGPSVRIELVGANGVGYVPSAGLYYCSEGLVVSD